MLVAVALARTDGMGSAVLVMIVNVEVAASGLEPRALVVVRDGCFLSCTCQISLKSASYY